jgi:hypothetical protein
VGHSQTLRFSLLQFCSVGALATYHRIDSLTSLQRTEGCISEVEQIDAKVNSKKKKGLTSLFQEPALIIIHFQHAKLVSLVLSNFRFLPHLLQQQHISYFVMYIYKTSSRPLSRMVNSTNFLTSN